MSYRMLIALAGGLAVGTLAVAAPAAADPGMPNCGQLSFVCNMIPMMPELDHDVDMTKGQPAVVPAEDLPPTDVCAVACI